MIGLLTWVIKVVVFITLIFVVFSWAKPGEPIIQLLALLALWGVIVFILGLILRGRNR